MEDNVFSIASQLSRMAPIESKPKTNWTELQQSILDYFSANPTRTFSAGDFIAKGIKQNLVFRTMVMLKDQGLIDIAGKGKRGKKLWKYVGNAKTSV